MGLGHGFASGFLAGIQGGQAGLNSFYKAKEMAEQEKMKTEIGDIANSKPEDTMVATPTMEGFKGAGPDESGAISQYDLADAPVVRKAGVKFLGQTYDTAPTDSQQNTARTMAMAGVMKKYNPLQGMQLEQQALSSQREEQRFGQEQKQWGRNEEEFQKNKAYEEGRKSEFANSRFGQGQVAFNKEMSDYQDKLKAYETGKASGKSPAELGAPPVAPARPQYTPGDALADRASLVLHDAKHGKLDARTFGEFTDMMNKVQSEGYEKALRLGQSGATIQEVANAFNSGGNVKFDPANVISDKMVKGKDGIESRVIQFKGANGELQTINTVAELDSLGKAGDVFKRFYDAEQNRRGNESLKIQKDTASVSNALHGEQLKKLEEDGKDRAELRTIRTGLTEAIANGDKPAEDKLRKQLMVYGTGIKGTSNSSPEERRALFYLASGAAKDETEAARMAHEKVQASAADNYMKLKTPNQGMIPRDEDVDPVMAALHGENWRAQLGNKGKAVKDSGLAADPKAIAIRDDKNLTLEQKRAKLKELGYQ
jgi:hypothetical protein